MRRAALLALCMVLVLASGCGFLSRQAMPTPTALPAPTATPQPEQVPSPTIAPAVGVLDLGVSPADTYGVRGTALDSRRGLLYIVAENGDASVGQGVLTVVDLPNRQVRASVPVPLSFSETPAVVLSTDGKRLYVAAPDTATLYVIQTDPTSLGTTLGSARDVVAIALDSVTERLYATGASGLRSLNAVTLAQEQQAALPDPATGAYMRWLAVNEQAGLLYVTHPGAEVIAVYRLEDLGAVAAITPGGQLKSLVCAPDRETAYALVEYYTALGAATRVAPLRGERLTGQSWEAEPGWVIGQIAWDSNSGRLVALEDSTGSDPPQSRLRILDPGTGQTLDKIAIPYLDLAEPWRPAPFIYGGHLYRAGETLIAADVRTGQVQRIPLGNALLSAALDDATSRLLVADSTGTIRVVDPSSLQTIADWPGLQEVGPGGVGQVPLTAGSGRLYVADYSAGCTWVLDAISGARLGSISKAGQISVDERHNRVFVTQDGVYLADEGTFQITRAIQETVRQDPLQIGSQGAVQTQYDPQHDLLIVTMSNNLPASDASARIWVQVYEGTTLERVEHSFTTAAQFVVDLALSQQPDRLWLGSALPAAELVAFALDGTRQVHLYGLGGPLFPDWLGQRLYVADWEGWVTVDATSGDVIDYNRANLTGANFAIFDARHDRLYTSLPIGANLLAINPLAPTLLQTEEVDALPAQPIQQLAVGEDGTVLAVNGSQWSLLTRGSIVGIRQPDGTGQWQISGGLPARAWPIIKAAPGSPGVFFAFSAEPAQVYGLFRSTDNGQTWHPVMRGLTDLRIMDLAFSPNFAADRTALLVAGDSGLFQTRDGGEAWVHLSSLAGYRVGAAVTSSGALRVLVLATDPDNPASATVYTATDPMDKIEPLGVFAVGRGVRMTAFAMSPNWPNDGTVLAGYPLQLSQDGGHSWRAVGPEPTGSLESCSLLFSPRFAFDRTVYALVIERLYGGSLQRSLLRSTDGGEIWERATEYLTPLISALTIAPDGQLWAGDSQGSVVTLNPATLTWQPVPTPTPVPTSPVPATPVPTPEE